MWGGSLSARYSATGSGSVGTTEDAISVSKLLITAGSNAGSSRGMIVITRPLGSFCTIRGIEDWGREGMRAIIVLSFSNGTMDGRQSFGSRRVAEAAIHSGRDGITSRKTVRESEGRTA